MLFAIGRDNCAAVLTTESAGALQTQTFSVVLASGVHAHPCNYNRKEFADLR